MTSIRPRRPRSVLGVNIIADGIADVEDGPGRKTSTQVNAFLKTAFLLIAFLKTTFFSNRVSRASVSSIAARWHEGGGRLCAPCWLPLRSCLSVAKASQFFVACPHAASQPPTI